jgi:hypothetical protein
VDLNNLGFRWKIDGVDVIASEDEVWFVQGERMCWASREQLWSGSTRLSQILREKGFRIHSQRFPKKLREVVLALSKHE